MFDPVSRAAALTLAANAAGLSDLDAPLRWLAWRDEQLRSYEPPGGGVSGVEVPRLTSCNALVVCGSAMAAVPLEAADLFVDVLYPAGCRTVVLSGGVGRGTLALWRELVEKDLASHFADATWSVGSQPGSVVLDAQHGVEKPVLAASDEVPQILAERRRYCCEADIMLELFVRRCSQRGLQVRFGGDPMADGDGGAIGTAHRGGTQGPADAFVYLETASTNSGANCALSAETLGLLGIDVDTAEVALVQHPQAHRRACLTWEKQRGRPPLGWCPQPTEAAQKVSTAEMLLYALGEFRRIDAYAEPSKGFLVMPPDFPRKFAAPLAALEPQLQQLIREGLRAGLATSYAASLGIEE